MGWLCKICQTTNYHSNRKCVYCWVRSGVFVPPPGAPQRKWRTNSRTGVIDVGAQLLKKWQNGNTTVTLYEDGSKVREWDGVAEPEFPETVDLKITDWCDGGCGYCHEGSTMKGFHAAASTIAHLVSDLPEGVEIALGGGDPLSHPDLLPILLNMQKRGLVVNVTVNALHANMHKRYIQDLRAMKLIFGLGISYQAKIPLDDVVDDKTIIHMIAGVNRMNELNNLPKTWPIFVLGYKYYGRGSKYAQENNIKENIAEWKFWIGRALGERNISFDSLALEQLAVRNWVSEDVWKTSFMGEEGKFSMYVNAPDHTFGANSTTHRKSIRMLTIGRAFKELKDWRFGKVIDLAPIKADTALVRVSKCEQEKEHIFNDLQSAGDTKCDCGATTWARETHHTGEDSEGNPIAD